MANLAEIRHRDNQLAEAILSNHVQIVDALHGTAYQETGLILSSLVEKLGLLKAGILELGEKDNLYSMYVLFRVFLEHLLRTLVIFLSTKREYPDSKVQEYLRLGVAEAFEYIKAYEDAGLVLDSLPTGKLAQWFSEAKGLSRSDVRKITSVFTYRKLIRSIRKYIGATSPDFLSKIIPNYSQLSAFVHGGPSADSILMPFQDDVARGEEIKRVADLAVSILYSAERWLLLLVSQIKPEFKISYDSLDQKIRNMSGFSL